MSYAATDNRATPLIILFGGTFDPVHFGHLRAAWEVREQLQTGDFRFLPARIPPHRGGDVSPAHHRLEMLRLALAGAPGLTIDQRELDREGPSYMVDTLSDFRAANADVPLVLVIGQDSANSLDEWHRWQDLFTLANLLIMNRPGMKESYSPVLAKEVEKRIVANPRQLQTRPAGLISHVMITAMPISSSEIRKLIRQGKSPRYLLPAKVLDYLEKQGLYQSKFPDVSSD